MGHCSSTQSIHCSVQKTLTMLKFFLLLLVVYSVSAVPIDDAVQSKVANKRFLGGLPVIGGLFGKKTTTTTEKSVLGGIGDMLGGLGGLFGGSETTTTTPPPTTTPAAPVKQSIIDKIKAMFKNFFG